MEDGGDFLPDPVKALREWFGTRGDLQRTQGFPELTEAVATLDSIAAFFESERFDAEKLLHLEAKADGGEEDPNYQAGYEARRLRTLWYGAEWAGPSGHELEQVAASAERKRDGVKGLRRNLTEGAASLKGWDTDKSIAAAEAVSPKGMTMSDRGE